MCHGALTSGNATRRTVEGVLMLMQLLAAQLCQIHDWTLNDAPPQPGLRTIRHGDTVLINGDDESEAPFIGVVHQVSGAASSSTCSSTDTEPSTANRCYRTIVVRELPTCDAPAPCPRHSRSCHVHHLDVCCGLLSLRTTRRSQTAYTSSWPSADLSRQAGQSDASSILVVPPKGGEGSWCEVQARGGHVQQV